MRKLYRIQPKTETRERTDADVRPLRPTPRRHARPGCALPAVVMVVALLAVFVLTACGDGNNYARQLRGQPTLAPTATHPPPTPTAAPSVSTIPSPADNSWIAVSALILTAGIVVSVGVGTLWFRLTRGLR